LYRADSELDARDSGRSRRPFGFNPLPRLSVSAALGLSLLYASGYFLPMLGPMGVYLLPTRDLLQAVMLPSAVVAVAGTLGLLLGARLLRPWLMHRVTAIIVLLLLVPMTMIALKGISDVAGFDWQERIPRTRELLSAQREFKAMIGVAVAVLLWLLRGSLPRLSRVLASLGYAYAAFAVLRILFVLTAQPGPESGAAGAAAPSGAIASPITAPSSTATAGGPAAGVGSRRVVWVIFDEADFARMYPAARPPGLGLANFDKLAAAAVFATNANSPASATLFSLPGLLTGTPLANPGVSIAASGLLSIDTPGGARLPWAESNTIFGALARRGLGASVLGFFHPYCKLFVLLRCSAFAWPGTQGVVAAFESSLPGAIAGVHGRVDAWSDITAEMLRLLPEYLARNDALTFVHLNTPHLPATYADGWLHLAASSDPLVEYSRNLELADHILGDIMRDLERQATRHELLLVVSSDHWLRNRWYQADQAEIERAIPFIAWRVGDTQGTVVTQPLSTVHTENMVLDYLDGKITTETEIAEWWRGQSFDPTFVAPNT